MRGPCAGLFQTSRTKLWVEGRKSGGLARIVGLGLSTFDLQLGRVMAPFSALTFRREPVYLLIGRVYALLRV